MPVSGPVIDVFINSAVEAARNKEESRCLQLQTRLRGGVDGGVNMQEFVCAGRLERVTGGLKRARVVAGEVGWGVMT